MGSVNEFEFDFSEDRLRGKTIILAGGTGGLGAAVAVLSARDGASLVLGHKGDGERAERLRQHLAGMGCRVAVQDGDIYSEPDRDALIAAAAGLGQELYGLVCLVGDPARVKFEQASAADLESSMRSNYIGPVLMARRFAEALMEAGQPGAICLFSTMQAVDYFPSSINYAVPKASLIHAARIMAKQWGGRTGIRVNVVAPGVTRAGMALASIASGKYDAYLERGVVERFGRAEDIARAVRFLMEPDGYVTGQVLTVDGGLTLRKDLA